MPAKGQTVLRLRIWWVSSYSSKVHVHLRVHANNDLVRPVTLDLHHMCLHFRDWGLAEGESIHVMGSLQSLGSWKPQQAPRMTRLASPYWQLEVQAPYCSVAVPPHPHAASHF